MKQKQTKKLTLNKKTVSVLQENEMAAVKGGAGDTLLSALGGITNPQSDSFIQCGSCFGACATNGTISRER
jgi:natural product precursor